MTRSRTLLLVEDDEAMRRLLALTLEREGYSVLVASNGDQALEMAAEQEIDLLVTDLMMPGMDGRMLAARLRERLKDLPVLYMSGYAYDTVGEASLADDFAHFLQKPFTLRRLSREIRSVLGDGEPGDDGSCA